MRTYDRPTAASREHATARPALGRVSHRFLATVVLVGVMATMLGGCVVSPGYVAPAPVVVAPAPVVVAPAPLVVAPAPFVVYGRGWRHY